MRPDPFIPHRPPNFAANYKHAARILPFIAAHPGLTAAEIANSSGVPYGEVSKGLTKAREFTPCPLRWTAEDRAVGGQRYRYRVTVDWQVIVAEWQARGLL